MRVLFLNKYTAGGPSSRYRVLQFLPFLASRGIHATVHALHDDHYLASRYAGRGISPFYLARRVASRLSVVATASRYDLVFIQKEMFPHLLDLPEWFLSRGGVRYVVDLDDAIHLMYGNSRSALRGKIPRVLSHACLVLAGNRYLEEYARRYNERVLFFPTVVDTDRFTPRVPDGAGAASDAMVVGWMGTPETVKYLDAIIPALDAAARQEAISLLVVGARAPATRGLAARSKTWSEAGEAADLRAMDAGVMPLADDEWSRGKCALKLIQYMSAGVASVSSPRGSALEFVRDGENAFFATAVEEWAGRVALLAQAPERRAEMGRRARATVEAEYSLRVWGPRFADALEWAASDATGITLPWSSRR
ncbi:MAG TPA: glycosyltransferase family 4 protein [Candidatus Krumholzibacteria bacterium]|nr:glycosyltransferase family 4 protein [Candidatus Krumholzibacteria bacterium]